MTYPLAHRIKMPRVPYVRAEATDIRKTFERVRAEQNRPPAPSLRFDHKVLREVKS